MRDTPYTGPVCRCPGFDRSHEFPCCQDRPRPVPPPPVADLSELLVRVESATAAGEYLDGEVRRLVLFGYSGLSPATSTDHALVLTQIRLSGVRRTLGEIGSDRWQASLDLPGVSSWDGQGCTPALALCAALLRHLIEKGERDG